MADIKKASINLLHTMTKSRLAFELLFLVLTALIIYMALSPLFELDGWPTNHEKLRFATRTKIYAEHFKEFDFVPLWSSADAYNFGTPNPFYYHRVFYYVSTPIFLIFGSAKFAILAAIGVFLTIGAYGMRFAIEEITKRKFIILLAAPLVILSKYTFVNWLVRGAVAELAAMMFIPWILWWCLRLLRRNEFSYWIVPILLLMFFSHNIMAIFALIILGVTFAVNLLNQNSFVEAKPQIMRALKAAGVFIVLLLPYILLTLTFSQHYDPSNITKDGFTPRERVHDDPLDYFADDHLKSWLNFPQRTVQIDTFFWIGALVTLLGLSYVLFRDAPKKTWQAKIKYIYRDWRMRVVLALTVSFIIYYALQLPAFLFVYDLIQPLQFIQFPWRLLAFLSFICLLLTVLGVAYLAERKEKTPALLASLFLVWGFYYMISVSPITASWGNTATAFSSVEIEEVFAPSTKAGLDKQLLGIGEYLPVIYHDNGERYTNKESRQYYWNLWQEERLNETVAGNEECDIKRKTQDSFEVIERTFVVECSEAATVALQANYSNLHLAYNEFGDELDIFRTDQDPRIHVDLEAGKHKITIQMPTTKTVFKKIF